MIWTMERNFLLGSETGLIVIMNQSALIFFADQTNKT
jgi:hypothetical protein